MRGQLLVPKHYIIVCLFIIAQSAADCNEKNQNIAKKSPPAFCAEGRKTVKVRGLRLAAEQLPAASSEGGGEENRGIRARHEADKQRQGYSLMPSFSRNCAAVIHFGCSISRLKKSLSPVRIISTSNTIAAFKIGWSFASRISFSAWSTAGISS